MKKMILFLALLIFVYNLFSQEKFMKNDKNRDNLILLKPYTLYEEIINKFGEPDAVIGSGFLIIQYNLLDGRRIILNFGRGDMLYVLVEISVQNEIKEIFNCFKPPEMEVSER